MKELDFDELDKAVSSLMVDGHYTDSDESDKADEPTPALVSSTPSNDNRQSDSSVTEQNLAPAPNPDTTPRSRPLAMRRSGRFMDVVHSSSDMKARPNAASSRQGMSIAPMSPGIEDELGTQNEPAVTTQQEIATPSYADVQVAATELENSADTQASNVDTSQSGASVEWPDPIALNEILEADKPDNIVPAVPEGIDEAVEDIASTYEEKEPLYSPFVAGAKVEKRPLGQDVPEQVQSDLSGMELSAASSSDINEDAENQLPALAEEKLPEEFQEDLMAIESDDTSAHKAATESNPVPETVDQPQVKPKSMEASVSEIISPVSIAPQYKEQSQDKNQQQGDIYNTDDYHQPLAHPAKRKSGWLWVFWIVFLIILGVGGGAALYLYMA